MFGGALGALWTKTVVWGPAGGERVATRGEDQLVLSLLLALACWIGAALLQILLYLRPAPHGGPFLLEWSRYFWLALYYEMLGVWLIALPFFLLWLALYRRTLHGRWWRVVPLVQLGLMTAALALMQLDHEILRFLGVRLNFSFLYAYAQPQMLGDGLFLDVLASDRGGAYLGLVLFAAVPALFVWAGLWLVKRRGALPRLALWLALILALVPLLAPANGWRMASSQFRLRKVEPLVLALVADLRQGFDDVAPPPDLAALVADYQRDWRARSTDQGWRFPDPERPYLRAPTGPAPTGEGAGWNVIYLQLETFRGVDMGFLRPDRASSPTPYLDSLVARPDTASWARAHSFGMPSINGLFATHCSAAPPSQRYISALTHVAFLCLPEVLRRHGYRAEMFNGGDTDWDNSNPWLMRWYDRLWRFPQAAGRDRVIFREAAEGIRRLGRSGRPFFASVVSVTNHTPFRSFEPALDIAGQGKSEERILNTTHYTDDVVREFIEGLRGEPWFARTLIVIAGDHGFNLGEHGQKAGQQDLYRESVWVPLIIAGAHPRLRPGRHDEIATLLDMAPTLADLLNVREANPWQGHSLLAVNPEGTVAFGFREALLAQAGQWTALRDPYDGEPRLFDARADWLQRRDLAKRRPALVPHLLDRAERARRLNDFLLRNDRIWRDAAKP